jgi:hypothetical protein
MKDFIMKPVNIQVFNSIVATHPQFTEDSFLFEEIQTALGCSKKAAKDYAKTHCNLISTYAIFRASGIYKEDYLSFFKFMLDNNHCNAAGRIFTGKEVIAKKFGTDITINYFYDYEDILNPFRIDKHKFVQYKIKGNTTGDHFMAGYVTDGKLYLSDTSYRGIAVLAEEFITPKNFTWLSEIK